MTRKITQQLVGVAGIVLIFLLGLAMNSYVEPLAPIGKLVTFVAALALARVVLELTITRFAAPNGEGQG